VTGPRVQVLPSSGGDPLDIVAGAGEARTVVGPRMGARHRTMCVAVLEPGSATVALSHPGEAVWYVVEGAGQAVPERGDALPLDAGSMVHMGPGAAYSLHAAGDSSLRLVGGPSPPDPVLHGGAPAESPAGEGEGEVRLFHRDRPSRRVPLISSDARLVVWPGVGAWDANMNYVYMRAGEENRPHAHASSEDTIFVLEGEGTIEDLDNGRSHVFHGGQVVYVPAGLRHQVRGDRGSDVESVGGPCPADVAGLRAAGVLGEEQAARRP
jgi:quercetin dioxygenase-like cupin family protein